MSTRRRRFGVRCVALLCALALIASACGGSDRSVAAYCEQLAFATGPGGAEVTQVPGDPNRVSAIIAELRVLLDRAPDDIATTTRTLLEFFEDYQQAPRDERRALLVERDERLRTAAAELNAYALDSCGLFLQRVEPTPVEAIDPGVEVAPE